jgi:pilus assembly protein CpaB
MKRPIVIIGVGVVFAAVAGFMTLGFLKRQTGPEQPVLATRPVVVALTAIKRGEPVADTNVKVVDWPADSVPEGSFATVPEVIGKLARTEIYQNDPLTNRSSWRRRRRASCRRSYRKAGGRCPSR